ncbi:PAQR family membrane homeostasis protein TrhA [Hasllibacter halocynthiae]|nr:hemolysin III family protein [Hasllibacter halocynthiae]
MANADFFPPGHRRYTAREEVLHALSHGIGVPLGIAALVVLVLRAEGGVAVSTAAIYGASVIAVYLASTLYHATFRTRWQGFFRTMDHAAIYLKIAGTYTPLALLALPPTTGIVLLTVVWTLAVTGIATKVWNRNLPAAARAERLSLLFYLGMGWAGVFAVWPLWQTLGPVGFAWLLGGGFCFTVGAWIYSMHERMYSHLWWHVFTMAGSACHFVLIWRVLGPAG